MSEALTIEMLPAEFGDCLLVGCHRDGEVHWLLIDGGTPGTAGVLRGRLAALPGGEVDLLVVTHLDADHIGGIVELLSGPDCCVRFADIWFNGLRHLPPPPGAARGFAQAETLTSVLTGSAGGDALPWNAAWNGEAIVRADDHPKTGEALADPPCITTSWGLTITLLSPTPKRLTALWRGWDKYLQAARKGESCPQTYQDRSRSADAGRGLEDLAATPSKKDDTAPNGSSIAFLLEFGGRSCLFAADAFATVLYAALARLARLRKVDRLELDAIKLPHHGSQANVLLPLFDVVRARHYLVSTNGARFEHPDDPAIARVITRGGPDHTIWFNYRSEQTRRWERVGGCEPYRCGFEYPRSDAGGIVVEL